MEINVCRFLSDVCLNAILLKGIKIGTEGHNAHLICQQFIAIPVNM